MIVLAPLAYLDPTSGGLLIQILFASVAGSLVLLKVYWIRFKSLFLRRKSLEPQSQAGSPREGQEGESDI